MSSNLEMEYRLLPSSTHLYVPEVNPLTRATFHEHEEEAMSSRCAMNLSTSACICMYIYITIHINTLPI